MADFTRVTFGAPKTPSSDFISGPIPARVTVHDGGHRVVGRGEVEHSGLIRANAADTSKFSGAGFTTATGAPIIGREIATTDRYRDPATGIEMTVAAALSAGLLQRG